MNITWLGHSCFLVESGGWRVVLDPYYVETYPALHVEADEVLCSHGHRDHNFLEAVTLSGRSRPFRPFTTTGAVRCAERIPSTSCAPKA